MAGFERLGVMDELCQATLDMGWLVPTNVQDEAIPLILTGGDVMIAAETGSGKTGAFALPVLQLAHETLRGKSQTDVKQDFVGPLDQMVLNPNDRNQDLAIDPSMLVCQSRDAQAWNGCRSNRGFASGKWYYEAVVQDEGLCRVGWAAQSSTLEIGTDDESFGFGGTGKAVVGRNYPDYGEAYGLNDVIGCLLDRDGGTMSFSKNGKNLGVAFYIPAKLQGVPLFPAVVLKNAEMKFNFGDSPLSHLPPGYASCASASSQQYQMRSVAPSHVVGASDHKKKDDMFRAPLAIIMEPTRELALQVSEELTKYAKYLKNPSINHALLIGGMDTGQMIQSLRQGVQVVVATPGRLADFIKQGKLELSQVRYLILDEADHLMDSGNISEIMDLYHNLSRDTLQVVICSATLHSPEIAKLAEKITHHATWVDLKGKDAVPESVDHAVVYVDSFEDKSWDQTSSSSIPYNTDGVHKSDKAGPRIDTPESRSEGIKRLKPRIVKNLINAFKMDQCLIFCRTQLDCDNLEEYLVSLGGGQAFRVDQETGKLNPYSCVVLHSGRPQHERNSNLKAFKEGNVRFLICTDVAARGIDISGLPYVINVTLPATPEEYIHRIGRVGRADNIGLAISIIGSQKEKVWYHTCNRTDRGRGCTNTDLTDKGGCCIWYDEKELLQGIQTRLGDRKIPALDPNNLIAGREQFMKQAAAGNLSLSAVDSAVFEHIQQLQPKVQELAMLEIQAQLNYLNFRGSKRFASMLK